jgi:hypothetical protein
VGSSDGNSVANSDDSNEGNNHYVDISWGNNEGNSDDGSEGSSGGNNEGSSDDSTGLQCRQ